MGYFKDKKRKRELQTQVEIAEAENRLAKIRANTAAHNIQSEMVERFSNSGYSNGGASRSEPWAKRYRSESYSPERDIEENRKTLRERSRDLTMNAPLAAAAINSTRTSVVGPGLVPRPKIDYEFLGISKEEAQEIQAQIKKEWSLWADSTLCDVCDLNNFYELQQIALVDWLKNGEEFVLVSYREKELPYMPYQLKLKLIEADRVSTEDSFNGDYGGCIKDLGNGNYVMNGVEINKDGRVVAYYISSVFPGDNNVTKWEWKRVKKRGKMTGNPNIIHIFNAERAGQYRGVPMLAPVIQTIKQLTRYTEAEIMAAVVNAILAIFVSTEDGEEVEGFSGEDDDWSEMPIEGEKEGKDIELGAGTVTFLKKGESVTAVESKHPSGNYDAFMDAMSSQIGAALEIAPEVLLKKFTDNFSASKGALNETWKSFRMRRKWFVDDFCQEVYVLFLSEAVSKGRIKAPGFFTDPLIKKAYTNATWNGPAQGWLNPLQEVTAAVKKIENGLSTHEDECAMINGSDYDDNIRTLINENKRLAEANGMEEEHAKEN